MDDATNRIGVEKITSEIRTDIKEKGYRNDDVSFNEATVCSSCGSLIHSNSLVENIMSLHAGKNVEAYRVLKSNGIFGSLAVLVKKVVRKLIKFYVEPIVEDQNGVNVLTTSCLEDLYLDIESLRKKIDQLEEDRKKQ